MLMYSFKEKNVKKKTYLKRVAKQYRNLTFFNKKKSIFLEFCRLALLCLIESIIIISLTY